MLAALAGIVPWILFGAYMALRIREPRPLPEGSAAPADGLAPLVSVVVPARNEARNIVDCLRTLVVQDHPSFEIVVVDDGSEDGTAELAGTVEPGRARAIRVIRGEPLPEGWFGKPWACLQGAEASAGELLLFTDADTRHAPDLLRRCVAALAEDDAAALSPVGRQEMVGFGERLVQPHMFVLLGLRYPLLDRPVEAGRWRDAILSGQYTLVRRDAYDAVGGHRAVAGEVVEDLRLGQELVRAGHQISLRGAGEAFSTRMYHSLRELVEGWSKNVATGARQVTGPLGPLAVPMGVAFIVGLWIVPPLVLAAAGLGALLPEAAWGTPVPEGPGPGWLAALVPGRAATVWAAGASAIALALWAGACRRFEVPRRYAFLFPLGAAVVVYILLRSWARGSRRIEWKGRTYSEGTAVEGPSRGRR